MRQDLVQLSKTIAHALRHKPELYSLELDSEGWVAVEDLLNALRARGSRWRDLQESDLRAMMEQSEKQRFELRDRRIRAYYGHSVADRVERAPSEPPAILYHGTTPQAARSILAEGLMSMNRQYVHLSADRTTAFQVGKRRTPHPVILRIAAGEAHRQGIHFYLGNDTVWLAETVPATFIAQE